jgi:hypothetical protein
VEHWGHAMVATLRRWLGELTAIAQRAGLWWGVAISIALAVVSLAVAALVVVGWPADHFKHAVATPFWADRSPVVRGLGLVAKNLAGLVLLLLGLVMALPGVPGQGVITMIIGLTLVDFPGKRDLERRLLGRAWVLRQINAVRGRFKRAPLDLG